jgi:DNA invertase Pin-like site-specific DNA recombinase
MSINKFVAYYRVSTIRQGLSGLGLDAQREAVNYYLIVNNGTLLDQITEVESGKKAQRPELHKAIELCRKSGATLLIAKVDRLARNVAFIANLLESGVRFIAIDMPNADRFMLHVYAAMAEEEGRRISERTRAALASAKARGVKLGTNGKVLAEKRRAEANAHALSLKDTLQALLLTEGLTFRQASERLNNVGMPAPGGRLWHSTSVFRVWTRIKAQTTQVSADAA